MTNEYDNNFSERPIISKPRLQSWRSTEDELNLLMNNIKDKVLNIEEWEFFSKKKNVFFSFEEISSLLNESPHPNLTTVNAFKDAFLSLPKKFDDIQKELFSILSRYILNTQEQLNAIDEFELYCNSIESENLSLKRELSDLKEKIINNSFKEKKTKVTPPVQVEEVKQDTPGELIPEETNNANEQKKTSESESTEENDDITSTIMG